MRIFKSVLFMVLLPVLAWSQPQRDLKFERISSGISNLLVGAILEDRRGFLWFGTEDGLNRYDGYGFKVFKNVPGDTTSLRTNIVTSLFETRDGKIWVGSYRGFSVFDPSREQFSYLELPDQLPGKCVYEDSTGLLWLGTRNYLYLLDRITKRLKKIEIPHLADINAIFGDNKGKLWLSSLNGFFSYNPQTGQHKQCFLPDNPHAPTLRVQDSLGRFWLSSWGKGAYLFDPSTETILRHLQTGKAGYSLASNLTIGLSIGPDGKIWIASAADGLTIFEPETGRISIHKPSDDEFSLPGYSILNVYCDRQGIIWVSTDHGIAKFNYRAAFFETCKLKRPKNNIANTDLWAMHVDRDGELWAGNFGGIYRIDLQTGYMENLTQKITGSDVQAVYPILGDEDGTLWAFADHTFYRLKKVKTKGALRLIVKKMPLTHNFRRTSEIVPRGKHEFWLAGIDGGIYRFDKETGSTTQFLPDSARHGIKRARVLCLEALPDGSFLAGIRDAGLVHFNPADGSFKKIEITLPHKTTPTLLSTIFCDSHGRVWIGTAIDGLLQTDLSFRSFRQFTEQDGLPSLSIIEILEDTERRLWISSRGGMTLINPENHSFLNFGAASGLRNPNALSGMCSDRTGRFYLSELGYIQMFEPASVRPSTNEFPVYITAIKEGVNPVPPADWAKGLHFAHHQNYINVEFVALNFAEPGETSYAYLLEGLNRDWQNVADNRFVTLAGLQPGNYRFRVRAAGKDGVWRECAQPISFSISGPFWLSWWFLSTCLMAGAGLIYYFYKLKINRLRSEIAIRNSIAQDLHDDVGSTLSGVNVFSTLALQKLKTQPDAAAALLAQISQKTTAMSDSMSDIVWSINPKNDSIQNLIVRMKEYAAEMLEPSDIRYKFKVDKKMLSQKLPLGLRKDLYLIFKEAINNLSKYSECQTAKISIVLSHKRLEMVIADDGKGFDETTVRPGNGLINLRARAAKLGGQMEIVSEIGIGTTVHCTLPIP